MKPRAKKRYGQHFLHDPGTIERIVRAVGPAPGQRIVEVGPGRGAITAALLAATGSLDVIEIDADVVPALRERCRSGDLRVHLADALEFDFTQLRGDGPRLRLVGNLPYNVSTPLLFHLLRTPDAISDLHIMLQREVIDRIVAEPDSEHYGRLGVMLAPWVQATRLFEVGPGAFSPPPQVWSAVARLEVRREPLFPIDARFGKLVAAAFSHRRKTLRNAVKGLVTSADIEASGIDPGTRPETLSPQDFGRLAAAMPSG